MRLLRLHQVRPLLRDVSGASAIEFALSAPVIIVLLMATIQFGLALQNFNALRSVASQVSRKMSIEYANGNRLSYTQIRDFAISTGVHSPYLLSQDRLSATVIKAATQRVSGATELTMTLTYRIPTLVPMDSFGFDGPDVTYSAPVFLMS